MVTLTMTLSPKKDPNPDGDPDLYRGLYGVHNPATCLQDSVALPHLEKWITPSSGLSTPLHSSPLQSTHGRFHPGELGLVNGGRDGARAAVHQHLG